jgi:cation diffusion facilitator CzcD-associated flavoprotein CzcO
MVLTKTVAIIGGGPSGIAVAKALEAENAFGEIVVFELQAQLGGVWNYTEHKQGTAEIPISEDLHSTDDYESKCHLYESPMYEDLITNIRGDLMSYKGLAFPESCAILPTRQEVLAYVLEYSKNLSPPISVRTNCPVVYLRKESSTWILRYKNLLNQNVTEQKFDFVVIANGHYNSTYIPYVPGLHEWSQQSPDTVIHSKYYVNNKKYKGRKVLVVGNAPSGIDISQQLTEVTWPVYRSKRHDSPIKDKDVIEIPQIAKYDVATRSALGVDGSVLSDIDYIIFCTGYRYDIPFMKSYMKGDDAIITDGVRTRHLYRHIFYIPDPTLSFVGLNKNVIPFPMAESQGAVIARVYSGRLSFPSEDVMRESELEELKIHGNGTKFHRFETPADIVYARELETWCDTAVPKEFGFRAEPWTEERQQLRENSLNFKIESTQKHVESRRKLREQLHK